MPPVILKYVNEVFGNDWIFQQHGTKLQQHFLTPQWCHDNFLSFIDKTRWASNSSDLNPLNYSICHEIINAIDWKRVKLQATLIPQNCGSQKLVNELFLKVVLVGLIDCIVFIKTMEVISDNKGIHI